MVGEEVVGVDKTHESAAVALRYNQLQLYSTSCERCACPTPKY